MKPGPGWAASILREPCNWLPGYTKAAVADTEAAGHRALTLCVGGPGKTGAGAVAAEDVVFICLSVKQSGCAQRQRVAADWRVPGASRVQPPAKAGSIADMVWQQEHQGDADEQRLDQSACPQWRTVQWV